MADEPQVVRGIDWRTTFPFSQIFRSFRVAIHPSKLVLALLALLLIYAGGRILDGIWPYNWLAVPGELAMYADTRADPNPSKAFSEQRAAARATILDGYKAQLAAIGKPNGNLSDLKTWVLEQRTRDIESANKQNDPSREATPEAKQRVANARHDAIVEAYARASDRWAGFRAVKGVGLFATFFNHQLGMLHRIAHLGRTSQWLGKGGVFEQTVNFLSVGPGWAFRHHPVYFTIYFLYFLIVWAIFGGAIARIAAVQVARDEKISFRQALSFSTAKFLSFVSAPIIPLLIIAVVGLVVAVGGLLFNVPWIGPFVGGALFFLALAAGFVMTLVLLGLLGGFNLMYPTIAVEGSDSFDAISRSFSYLYARPWRLVFYSLVAAIYGTICYTFVRYFLKLLLAMTHYFAGLLVFRHAVNGQPLWPMMWPNPLTATSLSYNIDFLSLTAGDSVGAFLVAFWVYLTVGLLGAFAISFYISTNTIIYILMRHEVDATELDDVYLEQTEEDFADSAAASPAAAPITPPAASPEAPPAPTVQVVEPPPAAENPPSSSGGESTQSNPPNA